MFSRFDEILACDGRTDGRTYRRTDILPRHSPRCAYTRREVKIVGWQVGYERSIRIALAKVAHSSCHWCQLVALRVRASVPAAYFIKQRQFVRGASSLGAFRPRRTTGLQIMYPVLSTGSIRLMQYATSSLL